MLNYNWTSFSNLLVLCNLPLLRPACALQDRDVRHLFACHSGDSALLCVESWAYSFWSNGRRGSRGPRRFHFRCSWRTLHGTDPSRPPHERSSLTHCEYPDIGAEFWADRRSLYNQIAITEINIWREKTHRTSAIITIITMIIIAGSNNRNWL